MKKLLGFGVHFLLELDWSYPPVGAELPVIRAGLWQPRQEIPSKRLLLLADVIH